MTRSRSSLNLCHLCIFTSASSLDLSSMILRLLAAYCCLFWFFLILNTFLMSAMFLEALDSIMFFSTNVKPLSLLEEYLLSSIKSKVSLIFWPISSLTIVSVLKSCYVTVAERLEDYTTLVLNSHLLSPFFI